jgi:glycosyltransferase involved in cell wall biosynthesis
MCTRLACLKLRKQGTKVFYTAHGFHFYKGAPLKNWIMYYLVEKICSYFTDVLITINKEDYALAQKKMKAKKIEYVPGVGIETKRFLNCELSNEQKLELRKEIGVPENAKLLLSVGELNENKNQKVVLEALSLLKDKNIHYVIAGTGNKEEYLKKLAKELGLEDRFHLLGHRNDVPKLYKLSDCFVHPSFREGLPVSVMEALCSGLPCVVSKIRGNEDLVEDGVNGFLCNPFNSNDFANAIEKLINDSDLCKKISQSNIEAAERFSVDNINEEMLKIYFD